MANLTMDADKILAAGEELKSIANEYSVLLNEMYERINKMTQDGTWESDKDSGSANRFIDAAVKDRDNELSLSNSMNSLGDKLIYYAKSVNSITDSQL